MLNCKTAFERTINIYKRSEGCGILYKPLTKYINMFAFAHKIVRILLYKFIKNWSSTFLYVFRFIPGLKIILFQFWMNYRDIRHPFFLLNDIYMLLSIFNVMFWHCFLKTAPFNFCFRRICTLFIVHLFAVCYLHKIWKLIKNHLLFISYA